MNTLMITRKDVEMAMAGRGLKNDHAQRARVDDRARYIWSPTIDRRAAEQSELTLDLLNWIEIRRELADSLDRCRAERGREGSLLGFMEERYRTAAEARDRFELAMSDLSTDGDPRTSAEARRSLGRLSAEASLAFLELTTYRNQTARIHDRIALIEERLAELDREIARNRARLASLGGAEADPPTSDASRPA